MKYSISDFTRGIEIILRDEEMKSITVFVRPKNPETLRVRITRNNKHELCVTYGKPNYEEREFLRLCRKAKTTPRKLWFHYPKKKK